MKFKKRFLILGLVLSLALFGYLFREPIFQMTLRGIVSYCSQKWMGCQVGYRSVENKNGKIVLNDVNFQRSFGKERGSFHVYSDEIEFAFDWEEILHCHITFRHPHLVLIKDRDLIPLSLGSLNQESSGWVQTTFAVEDGIIECLDPFHPKDSLKATFSIKSPSKPSSIEAHVEMEESIFGIQIAKEGKGSLAHFQLEQINLSKVHQLLSFFSDRVAEEFSDVSGKLGGFGLFGWEKGSVSRFTSNWSFEDLSFLEASTNSRVFLSQFKGELSYPKSHMKESSFIPQIPFQVRFAIDGGKWSSQSNSEWSDLDGYFSFNPGVGPKWHLKGNWLVDGQIETFAWEGKGYFSSRFSHWIETQCETDRLKLSARASETEGGRCEWNLDVSHWDVSHFHMTQDFLENLFPLLGEVSLEQGTLSFSSNGVTSTSALLLANINGVSLSQLKGQYESGEIEVDTCLANLTYEQTENPWKAFSGNLSIHKGSAQVEDYPTLQEISGKFVMEKGSFISSPMDFKWASSTCNLNVNGPLQKMELKVLSKGKVDDLFQWTSTELPPSLVEHEYATSLVLDWKGEAAGTIQLEKEEQTLEQFAFQFLFLPDSVFKSPWEEKISKGWLRAENVSLGKWSDFISTASVLKGNADLHIQWIENHLWAQVKGEELFYADPELKIYLDHLAKPGPDFPSGECVELFYDLKEEKLEGRANLQNVHVHLNEPGVDFTESDLVVHFKEDRFDVEVIQSKSHDLTFSGKVLMDLSSDFLEIFCPFAEGKIEDVKTFLSCFDLQLFSNQLISGAVAAIDQGLYLSAHFKEKTEVEWSIEAMVEKAGYQLSPTCAIEGFSAEFQWNSLTQSLLLLKGEGDFNISGNEGLRLSCPFLEYTIGVSDDWAFDVRLQRPTWDVLRLKGRATEKDGKIQMFMNGMETSFFGVNLNIEKCEWNSDFELENLIMNPVVQGVQLTSQLQFFSQVEALPFSQICIGDWDFSGAIDCHFEWEKERSELLLKGQDLQVQDYNIKKFQVKGKKEADWVFEEVMIDDVQAQFTLKEEEGKWNIPSLKVRCQDALLLDTSLVLNEDLSLNAQIHQLEMDLQNWDSRVRKRLPSPLQDCKGVVLGKGEFSLQLQDPANTWELDLHFDPAVLSIGKLRLHQTRPMRFHCAADAGFEVQGLKIQCHHPEMDLSHFHVNVQNLFFSPETQTWRFDSAFHFPPSLFSFLESAAEKGEIKSLTPLLNWAHNKFEWNEACDFSAVLECSYDFRTFRLMVPEIDLFSQYHLENITVGYENNDLDLSFDYEFKQTPFHISTKIDFDDEIYGNLLVADQGSKPMIISWNFNEESGFKVQTVQGAVCGMDAYFHEDLTTPMALVGTVKFDVAKLCRFIPDEIAHFFKEMEMGKGYELRGKLILDEENPSFDGILGGKQFELLGYQMRTLLSHIYWSLNRVEIKDLKASDSAGIIKVDQLLLERSKDRWELSIPTMKLLEFRPSLLSPLEGKQEEIKPLVIRELSMSKFRGWLDDIQTFTGMGYVHFINSFKRGHTVFDLPADFFGRIIGLDLELLIPVKGTLEYEVKDGKFFLSQLKETYSEGKRSKFFLVDKEGTPFVDFDGNLNIQIQMKQYVLFKITEAYILSIKGNVSKPNVSLERKKHFFSS